jgi:hypothetical protein
MMVSEDNFNKFSFEDQNFKSNNDVIFIHDARNVSTIFYS